MRKLMPFKIALALAALLFLIIAAPAVPAGMVTGDGTWQWSNPQPQGNTLKSVSFPVDANTGWAVGIGGTVMKTADAGANWTAQIPATDCVTIIGAGCNLNGVSFVDNSNGWVAGDYGTIWHTINGGTSWTSQTSGLPASGCAGGGTCQSTSLEDVHFINTSYGVAVASGYVFATRNGGANWFLVSGIGTGDYLTSVQMLNSNDSVAVGNSGVVYKIAYAGSGDSWTATRQTGVPSGQNLQSVSFTSQTQGFAVGGTKLWRTTDGGANWVQGTIPGSAEFWGVTVAGSNLVVSGDAGTVRVRFSAGNFTDPIATVASGLSVATSNTTSKLMTAAYTGGATYAYAAGEGGAIVKTADRGSNWSLVAGGNTKTISGVSFISDSTGWAVADNGSVMKTTDAGANWTSDSAGIAASTTLQAVDFVDATTGWAVGYSAGAGVAYKYSSGTWSAVTLPPGVPIASLWGIHMADASNGWMVGVPGTGATSGVALRTTDGSTWTNVATGITPDIQLNGVDSTSATNGWAVGQRTGGGGGVICNFSNAGAGSWTVSEKVDTFFFTSVDMVNATLGYAVGYEDGPPEAGRGYKTVNGVDWTPMAVGTSKLMAEVSFFDVNNGFIAGQDGRVRKTTDGGVTWNNESLGTSVSMNTIAAVPSTWSATGYVVFAGGANAAVLRSPMAPNVTTTSPAGGSNASSPTADVTAAFSKDMSAGSITGSSFTVTEQGGAAIAGSVSYDGGSRTATFSHPGTPFVSGKTYDASITTAVTDADGNHLVQTYNWTFTYNTVRDYLWTWYDNIGGANWVLMANPFSATQSLTFQLAIAGAPRDLPAGGVVGPGSSITPRYPGVIGGPVKATSMNGGRGITSQRILWGGNSLEEVLGTDSEKLSNHFWWTWYDEASPGYKDWVLVANPSATTPVHYQVKVAGVVRAEGDLGPGGSTTPDFPGIIGGPVEVLSSGGNVMASQRVLSNGGSAFNEVPGIPDADLSNSYVWTWYDETVPGNKDWVLVANPSATTPVHYQIKVAGVLRAEGDLGPGAKVTPEFGGVIGGPVEVTSTGGNVIASQRITWGPSFEEVPGYPSGALSNTYHWTWYDESAGSIKNWVLVANPSATTPVHFQVKVAGVLRAEGDLGPGGRTTPDFSGVVGGPVEVSANGPVMSSQRVTWNGFFNETLGTVLGP